MNDIYFACCVKCHGTVIAGWWWMEYFGCPTCALDRPFDEVTDEP